MGLRAGWRSFIVKKSDSNADPQCHLVLHELVVHVRSRQRAQLRLEFLRVRVRITLRIRSRLCFQSQNCQTRSAGVSTGTGSRVSGPGVSVRFFLRCIA